jgi:hypothetical protein
MIANMRTQKMVINKIANNFNSSASALKWVLAVMSFIVLMTADVQAEEKNTAATLMAWDDLIPPAERLIIEAWQQQTNLSPEFATQLPDNIGKVRKDLDGKKVKIPGFVIPLEGDEQTISEMLLVPYFGACFHVPPPPANQIIYIKFDKPVEIKELWDVVYVIGEIKTKTVINQYAEVGYVMAGFGIEAYQEPAE